jgi:peptide/nickel transport system substrate-binding protein
MRARSRPSSLHLLAICLAMALLAVSCGDDGGGGDGSDEADTDETTDDADPVPGGRLVYGLNGETNNWSAANGQWSASSWLVASAIFDPLMYYDADMNLKPFLAESVEPNEDHTVWTITTREGVTFHNGEALDADALLKNFEAQKASPLLSAVLGPIIDMEVTGERTIDLTMAAPWVHYPHLLAAQTGMMMAPEMIADPDGGANPIGTGPFRFEEWVVDDHLLVSQNADYWLAQPYLNEIEFRVITDITARLTSLDTGDLDAAVVTGASDAVTQQPEGTTIYTSELGEDQEVFLLMNQLHPPFDDVEVRRALVQATDNQTIVDTIAAGLYEPATGIFDPESPWYAETDYPAYDKDAAAAAIEQIEAEHGPLEISIAGPPSGVVLQGLQLLEEQWEGVGIEVELETLELAQYITKVVSGDYDVAIWQYHGSAHPDGEFVFLHSQYAAPEGQLGLNFGRNVDYEIDDALLEGRGTSDVARLRELYGTVQTEMAADLPYVMLWHVRDTILASDKVHDIPTWTMPDGSAGADIFAARHRFHQVWIES